MSISVREIAKIAGVSPTTVSLVINGKNGVSKKTRQKIEKILQEYNYVYSPKRRKKNVESSICIIEYTAMESYDNENQEILTKMIDSLNNLCSNKNINLYMTIINEKNFVEEMISISKENYDGLLLIGTDLNHEQIYWLDEHKIYKKNMPLIVIDNNMLYTDICSVSVSNRENSHTAIKYLYDNGIKSVGYLRSSNETSNFLERKIGFTEIISELKMEGNLEIQLTPTINGAYNDMKLWLFKGKPLPKAFYTDNGAIAIGAIKALQEYGTQIPKDISIISADNIDFAENSKPSVTMITYPYREITKIAISFLLALMQNKDNYIDNLSHIEVCGKLVVRESTLNSKN